jgi:hypothetical protein
MRGSGVFNLGCWHNARSIMYIMFDPQDPYHKLKPQPPTPADECCQCQELCKLMLQYHLIANPLVCFKCNLEVLPERVGLSEQLAERIAQWNHFYGCFYRLWLDSKEFEAFAQTELENPFSVVNQRSLQLVQVLNQVHRTYLYWFSADGDQRSEIVPHCPNCQREATEQGERHVCEFCSITWCN